MGSATLSPRRRKEPPADDASVGAKLTRLIAEKASGRTEQEIAEASGMSHSAFSRIVGGYVPDPRLSTIRKILTGIGASLSDFDRI